MSKDGNGDTKVRDWSAIAVEFRGRKLTLPGEPSPMKYQEAITVLQRKMEEDETEVNISESVQCFPLDGAVAFAKVLQRKFGWTNLVPQNMGFWGVRRPTLVGVDIGFGNKEQIPWGACAVPGIDGVLVTGYTIKDGLPIFTLGGTVKRKDERMVAEIAAEVRQVVREESIYRGKAVSIDLRDEDGDRINDFGPDFAPQFLDLNAIKVEEIIFSEETGMMLQVNLFNPIEHTEKCRKFGIPLKRGILLQGPFGTGKTLTADLAAKICVKNGWTFLYLEDARDLELALGFAELYAPCVVFAEDIDKATKGDRTSDMDKLFNKMDGVTGKSREVMVVLTTNQIGAIHPGFLRPGRVDTVIDVTPPDVSAIVRLVKLYGKDEEGTNLIKATDEEIGRALKGVEGVNAAFIREIVERAKLAALASTGDKMLQIDSAALVEAARTLKPHMMHLYPNLAAGEFDEKYEEVDPAKAAMDYLLERVVWEFLHKLVDPKMVTKIMLKKRPKRGKDIGD